MQICFVNHKFQFFFIAIGFLYLAIEVSRDILIMQCSKLEFLLCSFNIVFFSKLMMKIFSKFDSLWTKKKILQFRRVGVKMLLDTKKVNHFYHLKNCTQLQVSLFFFFIVIFSTFCSEINVVNLSSKKVYNLQLKTFEVTTPNCNLVTKLKLKIDLHRFLPKMYNLYSRESMVNFGHIYF